MYTKTEKDRLPFQLPTDEEVETIICRKMKILPIIAADIVSNYGDITCGCNPPGTPVDCN